jgi:carboxylesterase type B
MDFVTVDTTNGKVRGLVNSGVAQFKGVPYSPSTARAHRFRRPERPAPWAGVRDCFPAWPSFEPTRRATLSLGSNTRIVNDPHGALRAFWLNMPAAASVLG